MERTDLVVPAGRVPGLVIPPLAVTTGAAEPDWVDAPVGRWGFRRRPALRLPMDPAAARDVRRWLRYAPWTPLPILAVLADWAVSGFADLPGGPYHPLLVSVAAVAVLSLMRGRGLPDQTPDRSHTGDLRIPRVPVTVAAEWVAANPGVHTSAAPAPRPRSRRFYASWAVGLLAAAFTLGAVLAADGRENPAQLWQLSVALFVIGLVMAYKTQPPSTEPA
ncbi:hypothetical protein Aab01nite_64750 [Paractinoplanes abujensis]|uniref:Uncharacterized protein n=1 Tax=Paractinoplanes abujensis TaxID=882441 RepID=A0A7W7CQK7_9ACTN|nr:hypothetical protein [Actinoplanes abujensis]MBB4692614.1 hypothetical protein [Actinoplanes abujensis]GID22885.1 hypothetical protein Aab01nite_64750 [Actinoplanes abujensis]